ncbi:coadhesin-like isoform X4 [Pocillopora damicornis]|uniref:coadhesin-like isoform X4 n=1 Tax=Pocillopora damicornis TaxID=46731 RepID=UPI000F555B72|nr:coadhesin-like isoform X4 [Pocillopora damicornis]
MLFRNLLVFSISLQCSSAFWPFSESSDAVEDLDSFTADDSDYFNNCLDTYSCEKCFKIKSDGKCYHHMKDCRKTCSGCKGLDSDRFGTKECEQYKKKGYCNFPSFKYFKCQRTCSICEVDGNWGNWGSWSECSKSCGGGRQGRKRECNNPKPAYGGKACPGTSASSRDCNTNECPVDGNWGEWSQWSTCSKSCKQGKQSRTRKCNSPAAQYGGKACKGDGEETRVCNNDVPCPVNGNWGQWGQWSACTKTCKEGKQSRKRECNSPTPQYGGKACEGKAVGIRICNANVPCPVDGNWGGWSEWSTCTKTCKQGKQSRTRKCNSPIPQYGGRKCDGQSSQTQICNQKVPCPVDGNWGEWSEWSSCTKTCKQGKQSRTRVCNAPAPQYGGKKCDGEGKETQVCNDKVPCPVDGNWGGWSEWSTCTKTCKQGKQSRTRKCDSPAPKYGGRECEGEADENQICNDKVPCPVDGNWGQWGAWNTCSKTCKEGKQSRTRACDSPKPQYGGKKCDGESGQTQVCNKNIPCPVDGNWGEWGAWTTCSKSCGGGEHSRKRFCNSPAAAHGGKKCEGAFRQIRPCNQNNCPVDGNWSAWSAWSTCSKSCKQGEQSRTRECSSPKPQYGGKKCEGSAREKTVCNKDVPCPVDGSWGSWAPWSACSATCGYGSRERKRVCDNPKPAYNGKSCIGIGHQKSRCHAYYPCPVDGNWTSWGAWTSCTKTCGLGYRKRSRSCANPPPQYGGSGCVGLNDQVEHCKDKSCPDY